MDRKVNQTVVKHFMVFDSSAPVTGLTSADFESKLYFEAAISSISVSVFEADSVNSPGLYRAQFVPDSVGNWYVAVKSKDYGLEPQVQSDVRVINYDNDDIYSLVTKTPAGGIILIGTDYGGEDNLRYTDLHGSGIADADVRAYTRTDYNSGNLEATYIISSTRTDIEGRLVNPLTLSPGYWYSIVYVVPGRESDVKEIFISEV